MKKRNIIILAMLACILWGSVFPVVKILLVELDLATDTNGKIALAGMRFTAAGLSILLLSFYLTKEKPLPSKKYMGNLLLIGIFQTAGLYGMYYVSLAFVTGVKASVLSQGGIFYIIFLAYFFLGERIKRTQWIGILFGCIGIIIINLNQLNDAANLFSFSLEGEGLLLLSGLSGSIGQILGKKITGKISPMILNGWQMTLGGFILLVYGYFSHGGLIEFSDGLTISLMIYSIGVAAGCFTIWYTLLQHCGVNEIAPYRLSIPVFGSIFSASFLPNETFHVNIVFGLLFVVFGMYFTSMSKKSYN